MRDFFGFVVSLIFIVYGFTYSILMIYSSVRLFHINNINTASFLSADGWRNGWLISIVPTLCLSFPHDKALTLCENLRADGSHEHIIHECGNGYA